MLNINTTEAAYVKRFLRLSAWYLAGGSGVHGASAMRERGFAQGWSARSRRVGKRWAPGLPLRGEVPARITGCRSEQRCRAQCCRKPRGLAQRGSA